MIRSYSAAAAVAVIAAIAYSNSLPNGFVSDDEHLIFGHPFVQRVADWPRIFTAGHYEGQGGYRPLTTLSFAVNYAIAGRNPVTYHLVNVLLHALNSALVVLLLQRLLRIRTAALIGGLIFALHPVRAEAVAWISGRAELLAAFFFFLAWLLHHRGRHVTAFSSQPRVLSGIALFAALLSKENALVFPFVVIAADVLISRRQSHWDALTGLKWWQRSTRLYLPSLIAIGAYFVSRGLLYRRSIWRLAAEVQFVDNPLAHVPAPTRILTAIKIQLEYIWLLVWPHPLCADYSYNSVPLVSDASDAAVLIAIAVGCALAIIATVSFRRNGRVWFGVFFYAVTILPVANIFTAIGTIKAERLLYLPSFAFSFIAAVAVYGMLQTRWFELPEFTWIRRLSVTALVVLMCAAFSVTWQRSQVWRSPQTLWQSVAATAPNNFKAQFSWGDLALKAGHWPEAVAAFRRAHEIDATSSDALINLGVALMENGQAGDAISLYREAVRHDPDRAAFHLNLGLAYLSAGETEPGFAELRRADELDPRNSAVHFNLGLALSHAGDLVQAESEYRRALDLTPGSAESWNGLGAVLLKQRKLAEAKRAFETALVLKPNYRDALYNLQVVGAQP